MRRSILLAPALALLFAPAARADEGQWPPSMLGQLDSARLKAMGLARPVRDLWSEGGGLARAAVNYGGCTGAFVSEDGLFATNHHCAYGALQAQSTVDADYLKDGFVAKTRADELPAKGRSTVRVLLRIEDVTEAIRAAGAAAADDRARKKAIEKAKHARATACEAEQAGLRCDVVGAFFGARYELHVYLELEDVRLVFAPPSSIGEYGGEIDNWMWPRHS
ncbi:MAG: S46 family peptidase, partial [Planctomycetes bacterium]|nr:S46 family peptidase [Planctomycetota bacterium]